MNRIYYYKKTEKTGIDLFSDVDESKGRYKSGLVREEMFRDLMLKSGFVLDKNKTVLSGKYIPFEESVTPETCKEKFDCSLKLNGCRIYFEVSGTDVSKVDKYSDLYIKIDKLDFLRSLKGICYFIHILNNDKEPLIRVIKLNDLDESDYVIRSGFRFAFYAVRYNNPKVMSFDDFIIKLNSEFL